MKREEAQSLVNPPCPRCSGSRADPENYMSLSISSKGIFIKDYSLKCEHCCTIWEDSISFIQEAEEFSIRDLKKEGLEAWPFEVPIMLNKNETPYIVRQNVNLYEGRRFAYRSSSSGMSLRVAPGIWIRSGSGGGTAESEDIMKLLDTGDFTLTNRRAVFVGNKKTIEVPLRDIIAIDVKEDGLLYMARRNKKRIEAFSMHFPTLMKEFILMAYEKNDL